MEEKTSDQFKLQIVGMRLWNGSPRADGLRLIAFFDAEIGPILLQSCRLLIRSDGEICAYPPSADRQRDQLPVNIRSKHLREAFQAEAERVFHTLSLTTPLPREDWIDQ